MGDLSQLYTQDFSSWAQKHIELLKSGQFSEIDVQHLIEELSDMGKSERNELESRLTVLLAHLLKWQFQYAQLADKWKEFDGRSWRYTIIEQRNRIAKRLQKSPSLKASLPETLREAYVDAVELAADETGLLFEIFPEECPYALEEILDKEYYPLQLDVNKGG